MKETEKDSKAPATHTAASSQSLTSKKKFSWLLALPVVILVALVGVVIVINTFAATRSQQYVVDLYKGLLGRTVTANDSGVQYWAKKIDSGTSEVAVYTAIYNSSEAKNYRQKLINSGNYSVPGNTGKTQSDQVKDKAVRDKLNTLSNEQCVVAAYKPKTPDAKGKAFWMAQLASGKTCADVTNRIQAIRGTTGNKVTSTSKNRPPSPAECREGLTHQFDVKPWDTIEKNVQTWLKNQYIHYQGYASGFRPGENTSGTGYAGWALGDNGNALLKKIVDCEITAKEAQATIKAEEGTKLYAAEKQADFEQNELPVIKAMQNLLRQAITTKGGGYTCYYPSKKTGRAVDMLSDPEYANTMPSYICFKELGMRLSPDEVFAAYRSGVGIDQIVAAVSAGAQGFCEEANDDGLGGQIGGTEDFASCSNGGAYYTAADVSQAQAEHAATAAASNVGSSSRPTYGAPSGTMNNAR